MPKFSRGTPSAQGESSELQGKEAEAQVLSPRPEYPYPESSYTITGGGPNATVEGKKTLAHPEYHIIQDWWHPTRNQGKQPANFPHRSHSRVWLRCLGCRHGCGRHHEWEASCHKLTQDGGQIVCPSCNSQGRGGRFCKCQSVVADPRLTREWHPDNPSPASQVAKSCGKKFCWSCPRGHQPYKATCHNRFTSKSGCPECGRTHRVRHPTVSVGRPDLAAEWDFKLNTRLPSEVTLGSAFKANWICSRNPKHPPWQATVNNRALNGSDCPTCQNRFKSRDS